MPQNFLICNRFKNLPKFSKRFPKAFPLRISLVKTGFLLFAPLAVRVCLVRFQQPEYRSAYMIFVIFSPQANFLAWFPPIFFRCVSNAWSNRVLFRRSQNRCWADSQLLGGNGEIKELQVAFQNFRRWHFLQCPLDKLKRNHGTRDPLVVYQMKMYDKTFLYIYGEVAVVNVATQLSLDLLLAHCNALDVGEPLYQSALRGRRSIKSISYPVRSDSIQQVTSFTFGGLRYFCWFILTALQWLILNHSLWRHWRGTWNSELSKSGCGISLECGYLGIPTELPKHSL